MNKKETKIDSIEDLQKIKDYKTVKKVHINFLRDHRQLEKLAPCTNVEEICFYHDVRLNKLPPVLFSFPKLKHLHFRGCRVPQLGGGILQFDKLETLMLTGRRYSLFPQEILLIESLLELDLSNTKIMQQSFDAVNFSQLKQLRHLNLWKTGAKNIPSDIFELQHLSELIVPQKVLRQLQKKHPAFCRQINYLYSHQPIEKKYLRSLLTHCRKHQLNWQKRAVLLNLLGNNEEKLQRLATPQNILEATNISRFEVIRLRALDYYQKHFSPEKVDFLNAPQAQVAVIGQFGINKNELRKKLKTLKIKYSAKITPKTSGVVLGQKPKQKYIPAIEKELPIITEKQLIQYIDQNLDLYLLEEEQEDTNAQVDQLSNLLLSHQDENILLALALIKQGGFPKELLTDIFIAYKQSDNKEVRKETERIIRQYGSLALVDATKKRSALFHKWGAETTLSRKLNRLAKNTELDCIKIAQFGFDKYQKGINYLIKKLPSTKKIDFLRQLIKDHQLDLSGIGLSSVPDEVFELNNLRTLNLSHNYSLRTISSKIEQLKKLETLKLVGCYKLKNNKKVDQLKQLLPAVEILS